MAEKIRVIIADDHRMVRKSIIEFLKKESDIEIVGEAVDGKETFEEAGVLLPDVIVMDISMPKMNGIEASQKITKDFPEIHIVAFSMYADKQIIKKALAAGALGFVPKDSSIDCLIEAIHSVNQGKIYLGGEIAKMMEEDSCDYTGLGTPKETGLITEDERVILQLLSDKYSVDAISEKLNIPVDELRKRLVSIMNKYEIKSLGDLIEYAMWEKITV
ncbi:MAG: response regulator transcription factor [Brevinematales bacterium]|nr:response regulator transcription factor [Brevinematales bacterium]